MAITVTCESAQGGAVEFNKAHGVRASYAVATAGDLPPPEVLTVDVKLHCGRHVHLFVNRESGLVIVEAINRDDASGTELFRTTVDRAPPKGRKWVAHSLEAQGEE